MSMNDERGRVEHWMLSIVSDGGVGRFDDLHIDKINPRWEDRNRWIEGGLEAFRTALSVRDQHQLTFAVGLGFSLGASDQPCGVDFQTREDFFEKLNWAPPSLYLFDRGREPDKQAVLAGGTAINLDSAIVGAQGNVRCNYVEFRQQAGDEFSRSVFVEG
jgi:hypothetical protein